MNRQFSAALDVWVFADPESGRREFVVQSAHKPHHTRYETARSEPKKKAWLKGLRERGLRPLVFKVSAAKTVQEAYRLWRAEVLRLGLKGEARLNFEGGRLERDELRAELARLAG